MTDDNESKLNANSGSGMLHDTDDGSNNTVVISNPTDDIDDSADSDLAHILKSNKLYDHLYHTLRNNDIDYDDLKLLEKDESEQLCKEMNCTKIQTLKFRKLINIIKSNQTEEKYFDVDINSQNAPEIKPDYKLKVILIGDSGVGKTSIIERYIHNQFRGNLLSTVGYSDVIKKRVTLTDGSIAELNIWDTAGEETYNILNEDFYHNADIIVVCYGIDSKPTFNNREKWRQQIEKHAKKNVIVFLVGCKADGTTSKRTLSKHQGRQIINESKWKKYNAWFCECSAKTGDNISNIFTTATYLVIKTRKIQKSVHQFQQKEEDIKCICGNYLVYSFSLKSMITCNACKEKTDRFWKCGKTNIIHSQTFNICENCIEYHAKSIRNQQYNKIESTPIKIALVGDTAVGKSALISRYVDNRYEIELQIATIASDLHTKKETLSDGTKVTAHIWDTAGQERFKSIVSSYYRDVDVIMVCYAINSKKSLDNCKMWKQEIEENARDDSLIFLLGCKCDFEEGTYPENWQDEYDWWGECSAKMSQNVTNIFQNAVEMVMKKRRATNILLNTRQHRQNLCLNAQQQKQKSSCVNAQQQEQKSSCIIL
eukprot:241338_1